MTRSELIHQAKKILGGRPVSAGTRVPVQTLLDYLKAGDRMDDFLDDVPSVRREQVEAVLKEVGGLD